MAHRGRAYPLILWALFLLCLPPLEVGAEMYVDIYGGAVFTNKTDVTVSSTNGTTTTNQGLSVSDTWTVGGRTGYWLDRFDWLGFGLDVFFFRVNAPGQSAPSTVTGGGQATTSLAPFQWSLPVFGIGFDVLRLRIPLLRSDAYPHGRLQPYVSGGPSLFITYAGTPMNVQPQNQHETDVSVGAKVDAGVTFMLTKNIGLFTQYRFTHFTSELSYQNAVTGFSTDSYRATFDSHHVLGGFSIQFP